MKYILVALLLTLGACTLPMDWLSWGGGGGGSGGGGTPGSPAETINAYTGLLRMLGILLLVLLIFVPQTTTAIGGAISAVFGAITSRLTKKKDDEIPPTE